MKNTFKKIIFGLIAIAAILCAVVVPHLSQDAAAGVVLIAGATLVPYSVVGTAIELNTPGAFKLDTKAAQLDIAPHLHGIYSITVKEGIGHRLYKDGDEIAFKYLPQACIDSDKWEQYIPETPKKTVETSTAGAGDQGLQPEDKTV